MDFTNWKLREQIEDGDPSQTKGLNGYLTSAGFQVFTRLNTPAQLQKARPRVELKAEIGEVTGRRAVLPGTQTLIYDAYHFRLGVQVVTTPRGSSTQDNDQHELFLAQIRNTLCILGGNQSLEDTVNFPNLYIAEPLKELGEQDNLKEENGIEYSTIAYEGIICLRPTALN